MKNVGDWLKDADPVPATASPSLDDVARLRAATLQAAEGEYSTERGWPGAPTVVLTLAVAFALSGWASGRWTAAPGPVAQDVAPSVAAPVVDALPASAPSEIRQLQFATRGGTRIIWVFNPDFGM